MYAVADPGGGGWGLIPQVSLLVGLKILMDLLLFRGLDPPPCQLLRLCLFSATSKLDESYMAFVFALIINLTFICCKLFTCRGP